MVPSMVIFYFLLNLFYFINYFLDSANDMNTNAYKAAIHKVHDRTIYEPSNSLPFYAKDCGGGWVCFESRHKDWRFHDLFKALRLAGKY